MLSAQRSALVLITGALAITLAACGGGNGGGTPAAAPSPTPSSQRPANAGPPGVFGTAAAVTSTNVEVQSRTSQVTVNFSGTTAFLQTVPATLADVTVGACVSVTNPTAARAVTITPTTSGGTCQFGGFGGGGAGRPPNASRQPRPSGANGPGNGARAVGTVTAVSATGFTVHGTARGNNPPTDTVVTVASSTTYAKTETATSAALTVGECVAAIGPADDTGAVTAKTISISKPGPNGCGFGRRGGGGGNG